MNLSDPHELAYTLLEGILLAAGKPLSLETPGRAVRRSRAAGAGAVPRRPGDPGTVLRGALLRAEGSRVRVSPADSRAFLAVGRPPLGGRPQHYSRAASGNPADRLPPADHPWRDRGDPRRGGEHSDRQDADGAGVDPQSLATARCRGARRCWRPQGVPRLFQPEEPRRAAAAVGAARDGMTRNRRSVAPAAQPPRDDLDEDAIPASIQALADRAIAEAGEASRRSRAGRRAGETARKPASAACCWNWTRWSRA